MTKKETPSQKAIREGIARVEARRVPPKTSVGGLGIEAPGEDCPECHGRPRPKPCGTCRI